MGSKSWVGVLLWLWRWRLRSSWVLLAITSCGILASVTLMAAGAIYSRTLAEAGLGHTLASVSPIVLDAQVTLHNRPLGPADYRNLREEIEATTEARLGHMLLATHRSGRVQPGMPLVSSLDDGPSRRLDAPLGRPFFLTGFAAHSRLVEGSWPEAPPAAGDGDLHLEAVLGAKVAASFGFKVDSQIFLFPFQSDPSERIAITVVGLAEPLDPEDEYWLSASSSYFHLLEINERPVVPIYVPETAFSGALGGRYPSLVGDYSWALFLDTTGLSPSLVKPTKEAISGLETDINKRFQRSFVLTGLDNTLEEFEKDLAHARVPLFLFISLLVVVILYFLALVMGLLARARGGEASLLRSRGASMLQVISLLALGEGAVALLAVVVGPFLALAIARYYLVEGLSGGVGGSLAVGVGADMFVMGAIGAVMGLVVLVASGSGPARMGMVEFLGARGRPPTTPVLQRYYVDVLFLALVGLMWWQIEGRGGLISRGVVERKLEVDPSLLLGPVLVLLAASFLLLRLLPWVVKLMGWVAQTLAPPWASFTLARMARDPLPHGALAVMLMMAAALGIFGATFQSSLSQSQRDQALYNVGGDLVIKGASLPLSAPEELAVIQGVDAVTPVGREPVTILSGASGPFTILLTLDPDLVARTIEFRDDFAAKGLSELLDHLSPGSSGNDGRGVALPAGGESLGIWAEVSELNRSGLQQRLGLWARISGAGGRHESLLMGELPILPLGLPLQSPRTEAPGTGAEGGAPSPDWRYFEVPLPGGAGLERPFSLVTIYVSGGASFRTSPHPGGIALDDITVKGPSLPADGLVIEGYEDEGADIWAPLPVPGPSSDTVEVTPRAAHSGLFGLAFSWQESITGAPRGVVVPPGALPLPAIGGPTFRVGQELRVQAGKQLVPVVVTDVTDYFPTIEPSSRPLLLLSRDAYTAYVLRAPGGRPRDPEEYWVSLHDDADRSATIRSIREWLPFAASIEDRDARVALAQRDPLAGGAWNGLTVLGTSALIVAAVLALAAYSVVSVRAGRMDLAVARALGFSGLQLFLSMGMERMVMAVLGIGAGCALGIWLGRWVLGFLDVTASGKPLVPPMVVSTEGWLVVLVLAGLSVAIGVAVLSAHLSARKLRESEVLRAGE